MVVFGENDFIRAKWLYSDKSGCIRAKLLYSGNFGCIWANVVVLRQKWLYSVKAVLFSKMVVFLQSGCIRARWLY